MPRLALPAALLSLLILLALAAPPARGTLAAVSLPGVPAPAVDDDDATDADDAAGEAGEAGEADAPLDNTVETELIPGTNTGLTRDNTAVVGGVRLVGVNAENGRKLLFSLLLIGFALLLSAGLRWLTRLLPKDVRSERLGFWLRQAIRLATGIVLVIGLLSIWFDDPTRLATALGLVTAGLAFALQRVVTALAGYFVILRGDTFNVGDRIVLGGVRGDVIGLGFLQTTIKEMGQPPATQGAAPEMWVKSRQFTGRIVTVTNAKIFDEPVYNYTREFPYIFEEMSLPISYTADRKRAERILLDAATDHAVNPDQIDETSVLEMERRFAVKRDKLGPRVYYRLTDNWLELAVRFVVTDHGIRDIKDAMGRQIVDQLAAAGIDVASATYDIVGFPPIRIERDDRDRRDGPAA